MVVLGSRGKRLVHALVGRHCADALSGGHRETGCLQGLDRIIGDLCLLTQFAGYFSGAVRCAHLGARLCDGSGSWRLYTDVPWRGDRRVAAALFLACISDPKHREVRAVFPGDWITAKQCLSGGYRGKHPAGYSLPATDRRSGLGKDFGGSSLF